MEMDDLIQTITETVEGYPVKNLKYNKLENIILGQVKDPDLGKPELHDGYVSGKWRTNGNYLKEKNRPELKLKINYDNL